MADRYFISGPNVDASTPDAVALRVTGDIDVRADIRPARWTYLAGLTNTIASKFGNSGNYGWNFLLYDGALPRVSYTLDGTSLLSATATTNLSFSSGDRRWVRWTRTSADGVHKFYHSTDGSSWTQLGSNVAGTSGSLYATTGLLRAAGYPINNGGFVGKMYSFQLRSGIDGSLVANPIFSERAVGDRTWADAQGNTWTLSGVSGICADSDTTASGNPQLVNGGLVKSA